MSHLKLCARPRSRFSSRYLLTPSRDRGFRVAVTPETRVDEGARIKGETAFSGYLERVGGATPRVVLRISDHDIIYAETSEEIAIELGTRLYSWVGVAGIAQWDIAGAVEMFRVTSVLPYRDTKMRDAVQRLATAIGSYWEDEEDVLGTVRRYREDSFP